MSHPFSPERALLNLPLRKPLSSPTAVSVSPVPAPIPLSGPGTLSPPCPALGASREGLVHPPVTMDKSAMLESGLPPLTVFFCHYCGHQGNFRCTRCNEMPYCSVACQTQDWKLHKLSCNAVAPGPAKPQLKEITGSPVKVDTAGQLELKPADAPSPQRVYLKDLNVATTNMGTDIQASVLEFYSPGRFYLLVHSPELKEALQLITSELQRTYSCQAATASAYAPCAGEVCGVQFSSDQMWYRGLVQTLSANQKMAKILYIDFGNEEDVPVERIRPLTANIQPFCPSAMECCIAGVVPPGGSWSMDCCMAVRQLLAGKTLTVKLVESGPIHTVDILLSMGKKLSLFLVEHGYAEVEPVSVEPTQQEISLMLSVSLENFKRHSDGKDDNSWARLEPLTQTVGDSFFAVVTHFKSPSDIIVQKVEHAGVIQELQLKLREYCCQVPAPQNFRPAPDTVCCVQFSEDKQWYRAKILAYSSEERVCVGYLDFGNSEVVDIGHLRPITKSLLALPMQAVPCALAGVKPVGDQWSEACLLALWQRVSNRILRIGIQTAEKGKAFVSITDETSDPQADVAELLISAGYAAPLTDKPQVELITTTAAAPEPQGLPSPAPEPLVWSFADIPRDGQTVALLPTVLESPGEFYCHLDSPTVRQQLKDLGAELKQHCEADTSPFEPKVGEPCCAMFPGDGTWYRAVVKDVLKDQVTVTIMDYAHTMKVEKHQLRAITPALLTLPFQAVRCWLSGVVPLDSEWSSEALLWFQTLVDGELLSARVVSVTDQGYGLELQSRGQNVAADLISEQLARVPGDIPKETPANTDSEVKYQEKEHRPICTPASNLEGVTPKERTAAGTTAVPLGDPSFPVDWKTTELPLAETFQPCIVGITSPSLFYLILPSQDQQMQKQLMMDVATYCNNQASLSASLSKLTPGAACCARFSADDNWYRAVALDVTENELVVVYADFGNSEKLPLSRVLPIAPHLMQLPFNIIRCTLTGEELFPVKWPEEVQQLFHTLLLSGIIATTQSFNGTANVLSLTTESGGEVADMILEALRDLAKTDPSPDTHLQADGSPPSVSSTAQPDDQQPTQIPDDQQPTQPLTKAATTPQTPGCCCASLKMKIDHLEEIMLLLLSVIEQR